MISEMLPSQIINFFLFYTYYLYLYFILYLYIFCILYLYLHFHYRIAENFFPHRCMLHINIACDYRRRSKILGVFCIFSRDNTDFKVLPQKYYTRGS